MWVADWVNDESFRDLLSNLFEHIFLITCIKLYAYYVLYIKKVTIVSEVIFTKKAEAAR